MRVQNKDRSIVPVALVVGCVCVSASFVFGSTSRIAPACGYLTLIGGAALIVGCLWDRWRKR